MPTLSCIEIEPATEATAAVIWLHGLGASGHDFEAVVPELRLPPEFAVRFILPHAPSIPVTINGGMVMPAWYDILALDFERKIDEQDILRSAANITELIDREVARGIPSDRVIIAGFSQGGAVAYEAALTYPSPLAGLMALSSYFATHRTFQPHSANMAIPIHLFHGIHDPMVPEAMGKHALALLESLGYQPKYRCYPMEHAVCPAEISDISTWIQECLKQ